MTSASGAGEGTLQSHLAGAIVTAGEAQEVTQPKNGPPQNKQWLKASVLPTVFPQRMCDGVLKDDIFACIKVSYSIDPTQCSLDIDVTRRMASTLSKELFDKFIRYDKENALWVMELSDGTDVRVKGHIEITRAREPSIQPLLGTLVSTTLQNNPQRHEELAKGEAMTRLLTLSIYGDAKTPSQLRIILDAEMLRELSQQLWVASTRSL